MHQLERLSVIVMCGGLATRMGGEPKYLLQATTSEKIIDLAIRPAIATRHPITDHIILASGAHHEAVLEYATQLGLRHPAIKVNVSHSSPQGQFVAVSRALREFSVANSFAILYGDEVLPDLSLEDVWEKHKQSGLSATRVVTRESNEGTSQVLVDSRLHIRSKHSDEGQKYYASGAMILGSNAQLLSKAARTADEFLHRLVEDEQMGAFVHERSFNVNTPSDLDNLKKAIGSEL